MDREKNEPIKNKATKEAFIFGSWKCRNAKKQRLPCKDLCSKVAPTDKEGSRPKRENGQSASLLPCSSPSSSSSSLQEGAPGPGPKRRAISAYDQLNEQDFWCPRCSGKMEEPRLLPCLHTLCSGCVAEFMRPDYYGSTDSADGASSSGSSSSSRRAREPEGCPVCEHPLPAWGCPAPPPHYSLQHRLVIYALRRRLSQRAICCDSCAEEVQASQHCPACLCNFCRECGAEHELANSPGCSSQRLRPLWEARRIRRVAVCLEHPAHPLRYHCLACQQATCAECMWRPGAHRGHASEEAEAAGAGPALQLAAALGRARSLLNGLLLLKRRRRTDDEQHQPLRPSTAFDMPSESLPQTCHVRSRSSISAQSREARERIEEFSRLRRARYLIDAIFIAEDLLENGTDVEILSLRQIILKRLHFLGVPIQDRAQYNNELKESTTQFMHTGIYHCCTFCSSGGKKEATCACKGTMPGGYKGCGHGHPGHPGVHHWSCCGSTYRNNVCLLPRKRTFKITL